MYDLSLLVQLKSFSDMRSHLTLARGSEKRTCLCHKDKFQFQLRRDMLRYYSLTKPSFVAHANFKIVAENMLTNPIVDIVKKTVFECGSF
jgi:hypothetical protein